MKTRLGLITLLATLTIAGCTKEHQGKNESGNDTGFIAVSISQANTATKAGEFENGDSNENAATSGLFFIFNNTGAKVNSQRISLTPDNGTITEPPATECIYTAVLVVDGATTKPETANQIVCVLNAPEGIENGVTNLDDLKNKIGGYGLTGNGKFIMTNSVYKEGDEVVIGTKITEDNIKKSAEEAYRAPVNIYVERVVAKYEITYNDLSNAANQGEIIQNGATKKVYIKPTGIDIANKADKAYLIKNVESIGINNDVYSSWMWDSTNKRSYWEIVPEIGTGDNKLGFTNESYKDFNQITDTDQKITGYFLPNTSETKTSVLLTAELYADDQFTTKLDLAYIQGGYTTKDGAKNIVARHLANAKNYYIKNGTNYVQLGADNLVWKNKGFAAPQPSTPLKSYEVLAQLSDDITEIYTASGEKVDDGVKVVNDYLKSDDAILYRARVYEDGRCYYFVNIDQSSVAKAAAHSYDGVVRNHFYKLNLKSVAGIGTPVFDPDEIIIPEYPEDQDLYFIAADINVLDWRIVSQDVDFTVN